jgi:hypothetical protein
MPNIGNIVITPGKSIGSVSVKRQTQTTITDPNFSPDLNITTANIADISSANVENGYALIFNSITQKYEASPVSGVDIDIALIQGGTF